jgi:hypothetical protein
MPIIWQRKNPPATKERIEQFETKEQLVLPESYKTFLRQMNGGVVHEGYVPLQEPYKALFFLTNIFSLAGISQLRLRLRKEAWSWRTDKLGVVHVEEFFLPRFLAIGGNWSEREQLVLEIASGAIYIWHYEAGEIFFASDMTTFLQDVVRSGPWLEDNTPDDSDES